MSKPILWALAIGAAASACAGRHPYVLAAEEKTATLRVIDGHKFDLCKDGTYYDVEPAPGTQLAVIPAGARITVGRYLYFQGAQRHYTCWPQLSFIPRPGAQYAMDATVVGEKCSIEVVREDPLSPTGVSLEKTVGPNDCFRPSAPKSAAAAR